MYLTSSIHIIIWGFTLGELQYNKYVRSLATVSHYSCEHVHVPSYHKHKYVSVSTTDIRNMVKQSMSILIIFDTTTNRMHNIAICAFCWFLYQKLSGNVRE